MNSAAAAHHPLIMVEVIPLIIANETNASDDIISAPSAKQQLLSMSRQGMFSEGWLGTTTTTTGATRELARHDHDDGKQRKQKRGRANNKLRGTGETTDDYADAATTNNNDAKRSGSAARSRGLWLKPNNLQQRRSKREACIDGIIIPDQRGGTKIISRHGDFREEAMMVLSGDLLFRGKDAEAISSKMTTECNHQIPSSSSSSSSSSSVSVTVLRSDNPLDDSGVACYLRGFIFAKEGAGDDMLLSNGTTRRQQQHRHRHHRCVITSATVVQIRPPLNASNVRDAPGGRGAMMRASPKYELSRVLSGKSNNVVSHDWMNNNGHRRELHSPKDVAKKPAGFSELSRYDKETVESLSLRMSAMLANTARIGTTPQALSARRVRRKEEATMDDELGEFWKYTPDRASSDRNDADPVAVVEPSSNDGGGESADPLPLLLREGALLVHDSRPNSGKTTLVATVAKEALGCDAVHVISAPALFAKYGSGADAALEAAMHELALRCAVAGGGCSEEEASSAQSVGDDGNDENTARHSSGGTPRLCIVLDHLETFLPLSMQAGGDPYFPVLNAMAAYLNRLSFSLKTRNEFPFPANSPLYNVCDPIGASSGFTLPLGICVVGVATCSEGNERGSIFQSALDAVGGGRFRVPQPSAAVRLSAFKHSMDAFGVKLAEDAENALPELAAAATWASGGAFLEVARKLHLEMQDSGASLASEQDLKMAMMLGRGLSKADAALYSAEFNTSAASKKAVTFSSVGGNVEAKLALEDALALDPAKRLLLSKFGLQTPTGVLLYGPPGTGKTLLARAVAQSLHKKGDMEIGNGGGAFVALKASDIVRPEVGNSEKLIVSAFETARLNAPSVIFIDEFQALFGDRDGGSFILGQLASTLLQCMDDISRWGDAGPAIDDGTKPATKNNGRIVVLGATNTPWMIDKAFLRPGRFDRAVHVGLPTVEDSAEILRVHTSQMKLAPLEGGVSPIDEICTSMAKLCLGFSGADLAALCRAAAVRCLSSGDVASGVSKQHFLDAFMKDVMRSSSDALVRRISNWQP